MFRKAILAAAGSKRISRLFEKYGMRLGASRFVAGQTLEEAVEKVRSLNAQGLMATLDYLGESVAERKLAIEAASVIERTLEAIRDNGLQANVSVKLTQLGLLIDPELCLELMCRIAERARDTGSFVRIDMEDSSVTERTLTLFQTLHSQFGSKVVGIVIQSYLYRSEHDMRTLGRIGANVRIVKGAYREPESVAYPDKNDVDAAYIRLVKRHLYAGRYAAIATHDEAIVREVKKYIHGQGVPAGRYEFQLLYGVAGGLQRQLAADGYRVRIYTPFGRHWYPYFTRRIAERPANLWFVLKHLFKK